jgi:hypothetical protein
LIFPHPFLFVGNEVDAGSDENANNRDEEGGILKLSFSL